MTFRDTVNERVEEKLNEVCDKRRRLQIAVISELIFIAQEELNKEIEKYPFKNEYGFLLDGQEIKNEAILKHCLDIAEKGYKHELSNGTTVVVSKDMGCIRVDVTISDEY